MHHQRVPTDGTGQDVYICHNIIVTFEQDMGVVLNLAP